MLPHTTSVIKIGSEEPIFMTASPRGEAFFAIGAARAPPPTGTEEDLGGACGQGELFTVF